MYKLESPPLSNTSIKADFHTLGSLSVLRFHLKNEEELEQPALREIGPNF